jgi:hypothetical protein
MTYGVRHGAAYKCCKTCGERFYLDLIFNDCWWCRALALSKDAEPKAADPYAPFRVPPSQEVWRDAEPPRPCAWDDWKPAREIA